MMNTTERAAKTAAAFEDRMVAAVSRKLGCIATLARWIPSDTGDIPVFRVPADVTEKALALGLTVE